MKDIKENGIVLAYSKSNKRNLYSCFVSTAHTEQFDLDLEFVIVPSFFQQIDHRYNQKFILITIHNIRSGQRVEIPNFIDKISKKMKGSIWLSFRILTNRNHMHLFGNKPSLSAFLMQNKVFAAVYNLSIAFPFQVAQVESRKTSGKCVSQ